MAKARKMGTQSQFYCCNCGRRGLDCWRPNSKIREAGHLKKLFCVWCGEETNHAEINPRTNYTLADFKREFENCNFTGDCQRVQTLSELNTAINKGDLDINY